MNDAIDRIYIGEHKGKQLHLDVPDLVGFSEYEQKIKRVFACVTRVFGEQTPNFFEKVTLVARCDALAGGEVHMELGGLPSQHPSLQYILTLERAQDMAVARQLIMGFNRQNG